MNRRDAKKVHIPYLDNKIKHLQAEKQDNVIQDRPQTYTSNYRWNDWRKQLNQVSDAYSTPTHLQNKYNTLWQPPPKPLMGEDWNPPPHRLSNPRNQPPPEELMYSRTNYPTQQLPSERHTTNWRYPRQTQQEQYMNHPNEQHIGNRPYPNPILIEKGLGEIINNLTNFLSLLHQQSRFYHQPNYQTGRPQY